jgi:FMN-dependent NADH-azoreductase
VATLFRLDASIRTEGSVSRALADSAEAGWLERHPDGLVIRRDVGTSPLPAEAWALAVGGNQTPEADRTEAQRGAIELATTLADEILAADSYLFATPLYNFGVSQHLKVWWDLIVTNPRLSAGVQAPLAGKSGVLVVARGGGYGEGTPRHGWDHATPWLRRIFVDVWGLDLEIAAAELTLAGVNPAMADLIGLADESRRIALEDALGHGRTIAERLHAAV